MTFVLPQSSAWRRTSLSWLLTFIWPQSSAWRRMSPSWPLTFVFDLRVWRGGVRLRVDLWPLCLTSEFSVAAYVSELTYDLRPVWDAALRVVLTSAYAALAAACLMAVAHVTCATAVRRHPRPLSTPVRRVTFAPAAAAAAAEGRRRYDYDSDDGGFRTYASCDRRRPAASCDRDDASCDQQQQAKGSRDDLDMQYAETKVWMSARVYANVWLRACIILCQSLFRFIITSENVHVAYLLTHNRCNISHRHFVVYLLVFAVLNWVCMYNYIWHITNIGTHCRC